MLEQLRENTLSDLQEAFDAVHKWNPKQMMVEKKKTLQIISIVVGSVVVLAAISFAIYKLFIEEKDGFEELDDELEDDFEDIDYDEDYEDEDEELEENENEE